MTDRVIEVVCQEPDVAYRARWAAPTAFFPASIILDKKIRKGLWQTVRICNLPTDEADEVARLRREVAWLRSEPKNLEGWFIDGDGEVFDYAGHPEPRSITCEEWSAIANRDLVKLRRHIDSSPPEGWETA